MRKTPLSVVIITLNEAKNIEDCIASVAFCDEILVVDSGSTDSTLAICQRLGARVVEQSWLGYGKQKQFAVEQAENDWVLCLDADERVSEELRLSIENFMCQPTCYAANMPRCNIFMGRWLRHGEGYPDTNLRLFHRQYAHWSEDPVHEKVITSNEVYALTGDIQHFSQESIHSYLQKQNAYTSLQAAAMLEKNIKPSIAKLIISPAVRFIKFYFIRQGFRDGLPGFIHIAIGCINSFIKYAKVIEGNLDDNKEK